MPWSRHNISITQETFRNLHRRLKVLSTIFISFIIIPLTVEQMHFQYSNTFEIQTPNGDYYVM